MDNGFAPAEVDIELSKEQKARVNEILGATPIAALPNQLCVDVDTFDDVIDNLSSIVGCLRNEMSKYIEARDDLDALGRDIDAARRLFKLISMGD